MFKKNNAKICLFDMNGTLIDLAALDPFFREIFGHASFRKLWTERVLQTSFALSLAGRFESFQRIMEETFLTMVREQRAELDSSQKADFKKRLSELPIFYDVREGLQIFRQNGYRLIALTNSSIREAKHLLEVLGIDDLIQEVFSVEDVKEYKPGPNPYLHVANEINVSPARMWVVSGHAWDVMGAKEAGYQTALLDRPECGLNHCYTAPDVKEHDLVELAQEVVNKDKGFLENIMHFSI
jgi:2-haloacid dehalogenase